MVCLFVWTSSQHFWGSKNERFTKTRKMRTQLFGGLEISCRHVLFFRSPFFSCKHYEKRKFYTFCPSVVRNDVHVFFLLKNSTAPRGTPIPPLNDKKARKIKYEWSLFVVKSSDFIFRSRSFFSSSLSGGKGGACLRRFESDRVDVHEFRKSVHVH